MLNAGSRGEPWFIQVCQLLKESRPKGAHLLCRTFSQNGVAVIGSVRISSAHPRRHQNPATASDSFGQRGLQLQEIQL